MRIVSCMRTTFTILARVALIVVYTWIGRRVVPEDWWLWTFIVIASMLALSVVNENPASRHHSLRKFIIPFSMLAAAASLAAPGPISARVLRYSAAVIGAWTFYTVGLRLLTRELK